MATLTPKEILAKAAQLEVAEQATLVACEWALRKRGESVTPEGLALENARAGQGHSFVAGGPSSLE
jgi:hypothetical protein